MHIIRRVKPGDLDNIEMLAMSYSMGVTSLPKNRLKLESKLNLSLMSFNKFVDAPKHELYLFLLEHIETGAIGGISGIMARSGTYEPSYWFHIETMRKDKGIELPAVEILRPISHQFGPSEICSLFLLKEFRHGGLGKLLSLSRFLFMASHPHRFDKVTIASMRGVIKEDNTSPFWDSVGRRFVNMSFQGAMALHDKGLFHLHDLVPGFPIYLSMISKKARSVIGKVHPNTKPALKILLDQGFYVTQDIDIFDGGPKLEAITENIKTIRRSQKAIIGKIENEMPPSRKAIICTLDMDFRSCYSEIKKMSSGRIIIPLETAKALRLDLGSTVRYIMIGRG